MADVVTMRNPHYYQSPPAPYSRAIVGSTGSGPPLFAPTINAPSSHQQNSYLPQLLPQQQQYFYTLTYQQLVNEVIVQRQLNQQLQSDLATAASSLGVLEERVKELCEKNYYQARKINQMVKAERKSAPPPPALAQCSSTSTAMKTWTNEGCPLCDTKDHTVLNCKVLSSNGYIITYHSLLDSNASAENPSKSNTQEMAAGSVGNVMPTGSINVASTNQQRSIQPDKDSRGAKEHPIVIDCVDEGRQSRQEDTTDSDPKKEQQQQVVTSAASVSKEGGDNESIDDEIQIIGVTGKNSLSDFAHARYDCLVKPFSKNPFDFCCNCYCYVCDLKASDCQQWKLHGEDEPNSHCYAERRIAKWKNLRNRLRTKRKRSERLQKELDDLLTSSSTTSGLATSTTTDLPAKRRTRNQSADYKIPD